MNSLEVFQSKGVSAARVAGAGTTVATSLEVENRVLRTQLQALGSSLKLAKVDTQQLQEQREQYLVERAQLLSRIEAHEEAERRAEGLKDRIIILEAELERVNVKAQDCLGELAAAQVKHREQEQRIRTLTQYETAAADERATLTTALRDLVSQAFDVTQQLLPSFKRVPLGDDAAAPKLSGVLRDALAFMAEVVKARADAVQLVREKLKNELVDVKGKLTLMTEKEDVLRQSLQMSEDNMRKEQEIHEARLAEAARQHAREMAEVSGQLDALHSSLGEARQEAEIVRLEKTSLEQTVKDQVELISACEERLVKEATARNHLQKTVTEETRKRLVMEKRMSEMTVQLKLCGVGGEFTVKEEDLLGMVTQLATTQGALEVENCSLRDRLQRQDVVGLCVDDRDNTVLRQQLEAAVDDEYADDALTHMLLRRNLDSMQP